MLSLFPSLFDYSALAVGVLRFVVAAIFILEGYKEFSQKSRTAKFLPGAEFTAGILLFVGLLTQATAIVLGVVSLKKAYLEKRKISDTEKRTSFYVLLFVASISFLFLGPGLWSIDYPL